MSDRLERLEADVAIAGAGAGGCTVARELSRRGKRVVLVERGGDDTRFFGTPLGTLAHIETERSANLVRRTEEGDDLILGRGVGGGTLVYAGAAFAPDLDYWKAHGVEIPSALVDEAIADCRVRAAPEEFIGEGTRRLWDAAREVGHPWERLGRFVDFGRCTPGCEKCTEGCLTGAKWSARTFADEAQRNGAILITRAEVERIEVRDGTACGLVARGRGRRRYDVRATAVVCSAGAVGTTVLLKRAGIDEAGSWLFGDPTVISMGFVERGKGNGVEHCMPCGWHDRDNGCTFASCLQPRLVWHIQLLQSGGLGALRHLHRFGRAMGLFCKVADEGVGSVSIDGRVSKTFTERDASRRRYGLQAAERILVQAGCAPSSIQHGRVALGHPGGTVRVGELLDENLETRIRNLYCCDTSVLPEAPGIPPALTIVVLGKRLAARLAAVV